MMETVKAIIFRFLLLAVLLLGMNFIYARYFFEKDLQEHSSIINLIREATDAEVLYLGESSNITFKDSDIDKRPISAFVADHFPELKIRDITWPATHAGIYKELLRKIPDTSKVKTVVVTLNLRSFNANWTYSTLETSLQKSLVLLSDFPPLVNRFLLSFKAYDIKSEKEREWQFKEKWLKDEFKVPFDLPFKNVVEWDYWMATNGFADMEGNIDQKKTELACHFIKSYAFQIDTINNIRIKDFNEIIDLANKRGWNLVFNLLAENTEKSDILVGDKLLYFMEENRLLLKNYFEHKGVKVVDNFHEVRDEEFIDQDWTTEHYAENGRKQIAKRVAGTLQGFYPTQFVDVDYSEKLMANFFNDCEKRTVWGQMQTLTKEKAFSGYYSSKVGGKDEFSLTFEYPLSGIPDSAKNEICIGLKFFQESTRHNTRLMFQSVKNDEFIYSKDIDIKDLIQAKGRWADLNYHFTIPEEIKNADIIKVFLHNSSGEVVYLDDFKLDFR